MSYEKERDEAARKYDKDLSGVLCANPVFDFVCGSDWANARAEKMIAGKESHILDISGALAKSTIEIGERDAMIEKLEKELKYYSDEKNWYDLNHGEPGKPVIKMVIGSMDTEGYTWTGGFSARKALAELEEWRKSQCL